MPEPLPVISTISCAHELGYYAHYHTADLGNVLLLLPKKAEGFEEHHTGPADKDPQKLEVVDHEVVARHVSGAVSGGCATSGERT